MKFTLISASIVLLCFVSLNEAAIGRGDFSNPDFPGKCVITSNYIMVPGETGKAPDHPCAGITCLDHGHVEFRTCPAVAPPKGCKLRDFVNTERSYPSCCERSYDCTPKI